MLPPGALPGLRCPFLLGALSSKLGFQCQYLLIYWPHCTPSFLLICSVLNTQLDGNCLDTEGENLVFPFLTPNWRREEVGNLVDFFQGRRYSLSRGTRTLWGHPERLRWWGYSPVTCPVPSHPGMGHLVSLFSGLGESAEELNWERHLVIPLPSPPAKWPCTRPSHSVHPSDDKHSSHIALNKTLN